MGIYRGPNIVRDGLEFIIDPGCERSYPGTGTTVTDLSRNSNNLTLQNTLTVSGGEIVFDGTSLDSAITSGLIVPDAECTINIWIKPTNDSIGSQRVFRSLGSATNRYYLKYNATSIITTRGGLTGATAAYTLPENIWYNVNWYWYASTLTQKIHINGESAYSGTDWLPAISGGDCVVRLGTNSVLEQNFIGSISSVKMYYRELSNTEILQNFNSHKTRFGL